MAKSLKTQSQGETVDVLLNRIAKNYDKLSTRLAEIEANEAIFPPQATKEVEGESVKPKTKPKPR